MFSFIERVLTAANARCSYMGCTRRRHTGPCNHEHVAPMQTKPVVAVAAAVVAEPQTRETLAPARIRISARPSRSPASIAPPAC